MKDPTRPPFASGWGHRALTHHFRLWSRGNTTSRLFLMGFSAKRCRRLTQRAWWWIVEANGKLGLAIDWADKVFERRAVFQWSSCHSFFTYEDPLQMLSIGTSVIDRPFQQTMVDVELSESYVPPHIGLVSRRRREFRGFLARSRDQSSS